MSLNQLKGRNFCIEQIILLSLIFMKPNVKITNFYNLLWCIGSAETTIICFLISIKVILTMLPISLAVKVSYIYKIYIFYLEIINFI
jgi:hypothetical protein